MKPDESRIISNLGSADLGSAPSRVERNELALDAAAPSLRDSSDPRLHQANERTLLAWVRTGVGLMAFGFVIARFGVTSSLPSPAMLLPLSVVGAALVAIGVLSLSFAAKSYWHVRLSVLRGLAVTPSAVGPLLLTGILAAAGVGLCALLLFF